ncbi:LytR/AlgR family response regulator transcription factor [Flavihumibacter stibioxidans]|uniref:DNA-binding response regulator n=1 Tax=Flavihumibacter stibioxidans TaxID=1834163 RepID=A0ABR7MEN7_9BACT|nr:LytTR family DNA-binding domain-containing protein [Flavihumibacter stibioxidans]MBC6493043.1 DNA-binding response regulator [Flavihumibacter stibioxidans]
MMSIDCIIVEDEPLAMERMQQYVGKLPWLRLVASFDNGLDALVYLQTNKVDLVFLDINIGEISGIRLLETTSSKPEVIIITAYDEYAIKGFDLNVTDYLLKPYSLERFLQAVEKVRHNLQKPEPAAEKKFIFIKTEYRLEKLMLEDILYIEGMRDYRKIHLSDRRLLTLQTFKELEQDIPATVICRVHKSYMVNISRIDSIDREGIRMGNTLIPISDTYRKSFYQLLSGGGNQ